MEDGDLVVQTRKTTDKDKATSAKTVSQQCLTVYEGNVALDRLLKGFENQSKDIIDASTHT